MVNETIGLSFILVRRIVRFRKSSYVVNLSLTSNDVLHVRLLKDEVLHMLLLFLSDLRSKKFTELVKARLVHRLTDILNLVIVDGDDEVRKLDMVSKAHPCMSSKWCRGRGIGSDPVENRIIVIPNDRTLIIVNSVERVVTADMDIGCKGLDLTGLAIAHQVTDLLELVPE